MALTPVRPHHQFAVVHNDVVIHTALTTEQARDLGRVRQYELRDRRLLSQYDRFEVRSLRHNKIVEVLP